MTDATGDLPEFEGYHTLEKMGEGGMCAVYRVEGSDGEVAIKMLVDPSRTAAERFSAEAAMLMGIRHPNVLVVHAIHNETQPPWIVMELLAGLDLEETRVQEGAIGPEQAARWFADLAGGLAAVHAEGVRHRDIKPANIMLGRDGIPRLIDFGIARQTNAAHVTRQGFVLGTASYLPPEIFLDDNSRDIQDSASADVYALGQSLCEVLTGEAVHPREASGNDATILVRIMKDKVEAECLDPRKWLASVPEGLAQVVRRATAQDSVARTQTAAQFEKELRDWLTVRRAAEVAPLSSLNGQALPAPPQTTNPVDRRDERSSASVPVVVEQRTATSAPVGRVAQGAAAGAVGVGGVVGIGAILALCAAVFVGGVAVLWWAAPGPNVAQVERVLAGQRGVVAACRAGEKGDVSVRVVSRGGKVETKAVGGSARDAVKSCVAKAMTDGDWPEGDWALVVPVQLR